MQITFSDAQIEALRQLLENECKEPFDAEHVRQVANNVLEYFELISELDETQVYLEDVQDASVQSA